MKLSEVAFLYLENMLHAVIETKEQYVYNRRQTSCPLCKCGGNCDHCPHYIFNNIDCYGWLKKNSSFEEYRDIFESLHSKTIKQKCITRLTGWETKIIKEMKRRKNEREILISNRVR